MLHPTDSSIFSCILECNALLFASFFPIFSHRFIFIFLILLLIVCLNPILFAFPLLLFAFNFFSFSLQVFFSFLPPIIKPKLVMQLIILTFYSYSSCLYFLSLVFPCFIFLFPLPTF